MKTVVSNVAYRFYYYSYFYFNILGSELQDGDIWDLADTKKDIYSLWDRCPFYYAYLLILDGWN